MRSGRVRVPKGDTKTIIYVPGGGAPAIKYYRVYNSGRDKQKDITIKGAASGADIALGPHESVDFGVKNKDIEVTADAAEDAEVVYDFLG